MTSALTKWTLEDYHRMIEAGILEGRPVELLQGEIIEMAPEGVPHAASSDEAAEYLRSLLGSRAKVRDGKPITLTNDSEPEPDLAIVRPTPAIYRQHHPYPEDIFWLIEFSQTSLAKGLGKKKEIYAAAGIQDYWVVDLKEITLRVFRQPTSAGYQVEETFKDGMIAPVAFPDILVGVKQLFTVD